MGACRAGQGKAGHGSHPRVSLAACPLLACLPAACVACWCLHNRPPPALPTHPSPSCSAYIRSLPVVPVGCSTAFLFRLTKATQAAGSAGSSGSGGGGGGGGGEPASGALGKIEIRWRGSMGQMARLQTQQISLPPPQVRAAACRKAAVQGWRAPCLCPARWPVRARMPVRLPPPPHPCLPLVSPVPLPPPQVPCEVSLSLARLPARVAVGAPFQATLRLQSLVDRRVGPLKVAPAAGPCSPAAGSPSRPGRHNVSEQAEAPLHASIVAGGSPAVQRTASATSGGGAWHVAAAVAAGPVRLDGPQEVVVPELAPRQSVEVTLQLLALAAGQQALPALSLTGERDGRQYAVLAAVELFVDSCP